MLPFDGRSRFSFYDMLEEDCQTCERTLAAPLKIMTCVGNVSNVFHAGKIIPIKIQRIDRPITIVGPVDNQLGKCQMGTIEPGINPAPKRKIGIFLQVLDQTFAFVILDLFAVATPCF